MAVFYVLPPRRLLGECFARLLRPYFPGMAISNAACADLIDSLAAASPRPSQNYFIHREDLPDGDDLHAALMAGFGAELGDQVIQISLGAHDHEPRVRNEQLAA